MCAVLAGLAAWGKAGGGKAADQHWGVVLSSKSQPSQCSSKPPTQSGQNTGARLSVRLFEAAGLGAAGMFDWLSPPLHVSPLMPTPHPRRWRDVSEVGRRLRQL